MDEIITIIRALAISNAGNGITVAQLNKDFKNLEGYSIPYTKFGFHSLDAMLRTMTDAVQVNGFGLTAIVQPLTNEKSQHVREMVKRSKNTSKKPIYSYQPPPYTATPVKGNNSYHDKPQGTQFTKFTSNNGLQRPPPSIDMQKFQEDIREEMRRAERQSNALKAIPNADGTQRQTQLNGQVEQRKPVPIGGHKLTPSHNKNVQSNATNRETIAVPSPNVASMMTNGVKIPVSGSTAPKLKDESVIQMPVDAMTAREAVAETILPAHLKPKTVHKAVVTAALNPKHLHVHLAEQTEKLQSLAPYIDSIYRTKASSDEWLVPEAMAKAGLYCAAKYYNQWYRAKIMGGINHQRVLLLYIDYGYLRYVPLCDVRFLDRELASIPPQALQVSLEYVKPAHGTWSDACCDQLATLVHRKVLDMVIVNRKQEDCTVDVILTCSLDSPIDSLIRNPDESTLNRQLALRSDTAWSLAE
ncbi:uncharacterized protein LOC1277985 isoform X1 [Anopheles gambiae]|uniref:uncharacterized protein LOC1277985 isoform X1 n=1 Tax=Anopheles gambiae TaxID=7165 RepID=UPI002AC90FD9|nr:uncharacterized protein LOC1277985 isoform X1 [Anopheles gambiae]